jgi:hypothetical protein
MDVVEESLAFRGLHGICQGYGGISSYFKTNISYIESNISLIVKNKGYVCDSIGYVGIIGSSQDHFTKVTSSSDSKVRLCSQSWD